MNNVFVYKLYTVFEWSANRPVDIKSPHTVVLVMVCCTSSGMKIVKQVPKSNRRWLYTFYYFSATFFLSKF